MKKINVKNKEKLVLAIKEAEGRATARTVTYDDIVSVLEDIKVPKSRLHGTIVKYDGGQHFPRAYKYRPESTHWTAINSHGKWYITEICRSYCPNRLSNGFISYSEDAKKWILSKASEI